MTTQLINGLIYFAAITVGVIVGFAFGKMQEIARERYLKKQKSGKLSSGAGIIPGSMQRIALFLVVLVLIQVGLPMLFEGNIQWMVSAGVIVGYGWTLLQQFKKKASYSVSK